MHQPLPAQNQRNSRLKENAFFSDKNNLFFKPVMQAKLTVNREGDAQEQEADAMADKVMRKASANAVQRKCQHCEEEEKQVQRKEDTAGNVQADAATEHYISNLDGK